MYARLSTCSSSRSFSQMAQRVQPDEITVNVSTAPNQPRNISFASQTFGKQSPVYRTFQVSWFDKWPWLHYDVSQDASFAVKL